MPRVIPTIQSLTENQPSRGHDSWILHQTCEAMHYPVAKAATVSGRMFVAAGGGGEGVWRRRNWTEERQMAFPAGKEFLAEVEGTPPEPVELKRSISLRRRQASRRAT
jgi:hypothetical protein